MENSQFNFRPSYVMHDPTQPGKSNLPVPTDTGARNLGFRSGAANPAITPHETEAVAAGAALGEPTSFRSGAGAPPPVAIMRGMRTTFQNPAADQPGGGYVQTPGSSPQEFATPTQAGQAWHQGMAGTETAVADARGITDPGIATRHGTFHVPGQTVAEIQATKEGPGATQERLMKGKLFEQQQQEILRTQDVAKVKKNTEAFDQLMHESPYSTFDTTTGQGKFKAKDESQYRDYLASKKIGQEDPQAGRKHFEDRQMVRQYLQTQKLQPGFNADAALDAASSSPEVWQSLVADAQKVMGVSKPAPKPSFWGNLMGPTQLQGEAGTVPPAAPTAPPVRPTQPPAGFRGLVESME